MRASATVSAANHLPPELRAAIGRGWRLHPCVARQKIPLLKNWPLLATRDPSIVERWSARYRDCNWGVALGEQTGAFVVDIDGQDGENSLAVLERSYSPMPSTLVCLTARGRHFWLRYPSELRIGNTAGKLGPGIDIRGEGGYSLIPPSVHPTGAAYRWKHLGQNIAQAPEWLLRMLSTAERVKPRPDTDSSILTTGERNDGLTKLAGGMRRQGASASEIEDALTEANQARCNPPLPQQEVKAITGSVGRYTPKTRDIVDAAVEMMEAEEYSSLRERFRVIAEILQKLNGGEAVALPCERIAHELHCDHTIIARYRRDGVLAGWLRLVKPYDVREGRASIFAVTPCPTRDRDIQISHMGGGALSGTHHESLNGIGRKSLSGTRKEHEMESLSGTPQISLSGTRVPALSETPSGTGAARTNFPQCPRCGSYALYRDGNTGTFECLTCEQPNVMEDEARIARAPFDPSIFNLESVQ